MLFLAADATPPHLGMGYVSGPTVAEFAAAGDPLPEPRVRELGAQLAGALAALHADYLHGDVKPDNIRVDASGRASCRPRLCAPNR